MFLKQKSATQPTVLSERHRGILPVEAHLLVYQLVGPLSIDQISVNMTFLMTKLDQILALDSFLCPQKGTVMLWAKLKTETGLQAPKNSPPRLLHRLETQLTEKAKMMEDVDRAIQN
jgi:hypothetical protein